MWPKRISPCGGGRRWHDDKQPPGCENPGVRGKPFPEAGVRMGDWFSGAAIYVPAWVLAGTAMGLWGVTNVSPLATAAWLAIGFVIAGLAWYASAQQVKQERAIADNLGKLVNVTEPSPRNILVAAAAKILTLDHEISELKGELAACKSREWAFPTEGQKDRCVRIIKRTGHEEVGQQRISLLRDDLPDCVYVTDEFEKIFSKAGYKFIKETNRHDKPIPPGVWVYAPPGHPDAGVLIRGLAEIFGPGFVQQMEMDRGPFPAFLDRAIALVVMIGRKPYQ